MRGKAVLVLLVALLVAACAGGGARYGCPAEAGYACESVSRVYSDVTRGGLDGERSHNEKRKKRFPEGGPLHSGESGRNYEGERSAEGSLGGEAMPVYVPPRVIRIRIAPWQDTDGIFHSEKYIYALPGKGRWTLRGKTVPLGGQRDWGARNLRLRGTEQ